jgi:hypothetical protein
MTARRRGAVAAGVTLALLLSACMSACVPGADSAVPTPSPSTVTRTPTPTPTPTPVPVFLAPLTGIEIGAGDLLGPSIAAKIDNHPAARPQVALESADIVFEELVEGGLTRYLAVWHSRIPAELGPVRSVRPMDPDIVAPFGGIIAYSGGQERFVEQMEATGVLNAIHGQEATAEVFYRSQSRFSPHNVLVQAQTLVAQHAALAAPARQFDYSATGEPSSAAVVGTATSTFVLSFSPESARAWSWDTIRGVWARSQDGAPDADEAGVAYGATNVVVLRVPVTDDRDVPKTELIGSGEAWVASAGSVLHGSWSKASAADRIVLVDDAGAPIALQPGSTWVELVPLAGSVGLPAPVVP